MLTLRPEKTQRFFFDRDLVAQRVRRQEAKQLSRIGAFVRTTARRSMRSGGKRRVSSPPGTPPRVHVGYLKNFLPFVFDPSTRTVVVGPLSLTRASGYVPNLLEFGGTNPKTGKRYAARPFMGPALQNNLDQIPKQWRNSVSL